MFFWGGILKRLLACKFHYTPDPFRKKFLRRAREIDSVKITGA